MEDNDRENELKRQLLTLRIIWAALLLGQLIYLGVSLAIGKNMPEPDASMARILWYVTIGSLLVMLPIAYALRLMIYAKGRSNDVITPQAYATGNILFWAMCEGVSMLAITTSMLNRHQGTYLYVAMIAFAVQVVNYPTGKLMRPEDDRDRAINPMLGDKR
jgi:hypothetical protein